MTERISIEKIIEDIRKDIDGRQAPISEKYLLTPYYMKRIAEIKKMDKIVIVGAGLYGVRLYEMLELEGISAKVCCFCDNNVGQKGYLFHEMPILNVEEAVRCNTDAFYVITPRFYENELLQQLGELGIPIGRIMIMTFGYTGLID